LPCFLKLGHRTTYLEEFGISFSSDLHEVLVGLVVSPSVFRVLLELKEKMHFAKLWQRAIPFLQHLLVCLENFLVVAFVSLLLLLQLRLALPMNQADWMMTMIVRLSAYYALSAVEKHLDSSCAVKVLQTLLGCLKWILSKVPLLGCVVLQRFVLHPFAVKGFCGGPHQWRLCPIQDRFAIVADVEVNHHVAVGSIDFLLLWIACDRWVAICWLG